MNSCVHNIIVGQLWIEQVSDIGAGGGGVVGEPRIIGDGRVRGRKGKIAGDKSLKGRKREK